MTYEEFCEIIRAGIASGELKTTRALLYGKFSTMSKSVLVPCRSKELNELDLAIQYAIGQEMQERGGGELQTTAEEIYFLIGKHCGADVQKRLFSD